MFNVFLGVNHKDTKPTKVAFVAAFVPFVSSWLTTRTAYSIAKGGFAIRS